MRYVITAVLLLLFWSCDTAKKNKVLTGDLYFSFIRVGSYYNISDSIRTGFERYADTVNLEKADKEVIALVKNYKKLKEEKLIYKPFIDLLVNNELVVKLYLDSTDYDRIKIYKLKQLHKETKKVRIEAMVREFDEGFYYCEDLIKVELVEGKTLMKQKKLRIEDYN